MEFIRNWTNTNQVQCNCQAMVKKEMSFKVNARFVRMLGFLKKFMGEHDLIRPQQEVCVALSGGNDSVALLLFMHALYKEGAIARLRAHHINHGTRPACQAEEQSVRQLCQSLDVPLSVDHPKLDLGSANFEQMARQSRYQLLLKDLGACELLLTGHHIDDSYEWWFLQTHKTSSLHKAPGIPLVHGRIRRPLHCFSRFQLELLMKSLGMDLAQDDSNLDQRFERAKLRVVIAPFLKLHYPGYLRHFVNRANHQAQMQGKHRRQDLSKLKRGHSSPGHKVMDDGLGGKVLLYDQSNLPEWQVYAAIEKIICQLSHCQRGKLSQQIKKIMAGAGTGRRGPYSFSGGVEGHPDKNQIHFIKAAQRARYQAVGAERMPYLFFKDEIKGLRRVKKFSPLLAEREDFLHLATHYYAYSAGQVWTWQQSNALHCGISNQNPTA